VGFEFVCCKSDAKFAFAAVKRYNVRFQRCNFLKTV
jgi:hypothetical protein